LRLLSLDLGVPYMTWAHIVLENVPLSHAASQKLGYLSILTRLLSGRPGFDPRQKEGFLFLRHDVQKSCGTHLASCPMGTGGPFLEDKAARV
jgi:hypothetical protein